MQISHFSIKQLTILASIMMAGTFVVCYLSFRYFWTYDAAMEQVYAQQQEEVHRVKTLLDIQKSNLAQGLVDYAAWDEVAKFIQGQSHDFLDSSLNDHSFAAQQINGIFIFNADVSLIWGRLYDYIYKQELSYEEIRYKFGSLLADSLRSRTDQITPFVQYLVLNGKPHLVATSRVCNSDGMDCDKGYMMFIKQIGDQFSQTLMQATGLDVDIWTKQQAQARNFQPSADVSVIEKLDYRNQPNVCVIIRHLATTPPFITWKELSALLAFACFMFVFNLSVVHIMVKPITRARYALDSLSKGQSSQLTDQDTFISYEMRDFVNRINEIFNQLELKQKELEWLALHDALTTVGNRRSLQQHWTRLLEGQPRCTSVILIDIDFFKPFNDNYGHIEGDKVLQIVAKTLQHCDSDSDKFVARFGGEEFCVILSSDSPIDSIEEANQLRVAIEQLQIAHEFSPISSYLTISAGVVECRLTSSDKLQDKIRLADAALYAAKQQGRNRLVVHVDD
ncbi:sensor domain-containing diguanylate cyclase [Vibrio sinaloensis]|uniref:sensor domain-containing diguanylate cyclase n=1 Tax=Photobacterium sp. (strain ATCC 43367) TaxID=379097 RepID=UPI0035E5B640